MRPLRHGYNNRTLGDGTTVVKRYEGPDAASRLERERLVLTDLAGEIPVPPVLGVRDGALELGFVDGVPGQELLDGGFAVEVLRSCGAVLRRIHSVRPGVLVHGDFGPNNLLLDPDTFEVAAVVDWEFSHIGDPLDDLAWCEWIVRTHHADRVGAIDHFFSAYGGSVPPWPVRQAAMLERCGQLREFCERWEPGGAGVRLWEERAETTAAWRQ